ncbi:MAG: HTTM domain-containing protein [Tunicatimonas sp.]
MRSTTVVHQSQPTFWQNLFFKPVDNSPLVLFRGAFGLLIALEAGGAIATGWVRRVFVAPDYTFNFIGFDWLQPLVGEPMYVLYAAMAALGVMVMLGYYYRFAVTLFGLLWTISYLLQKTSYNNHYYLLILLCGMMAMVPAHRYWSLDVTQGRVAPTISCPRWCLLIFGLQVGIVYFFAAVAKLYPGWLSSDPIAGWLSNKADYFIIGPWLQAAWLPQLVAYGGVAFDALIVPLLLWRRTRRFAFVVGLGFHFFNSMVFHIGIFPYLMIAICVFYFPPEQIRGWFFKNKPKLTLTGATPYPAQPWLVVLFAIYFAWQLYLPLRHHLYYGDVLWTEEGHRMAWRMMLRSRWGNTSFRVVDTATKKSWEVNLSDHLTAKQARKVAANPDMIWQFSQRLERAYREKGYADVEIYATARVSVNGSKLMPLTDPTVDLTRVNWTPFRHAGWIVPFPEN